MAKKVYYALCTTCNATNGFSAFTTFEGEIFYICNECESDEIIFHQDLYQDTDNGKKLANTAMEVDYDHHNR